MCLFARGCYLNVVGLGYKLAYPLRTDCPPSRLLPYFLAASWINSKGVFTMKHGRSQTRLYRLRSWLVTLSVMGGLILSAWGLISFSAVIGNAARSYLEGNFTNTDNAAVQQRDRTFLPLARRKR